MIEQTLFDVKNRSEVACETLTHYYVDSSDCRRFELGTFRFGMERRRLLGHYACDDHLHPRRPFGDLRVGCP